MYQKKGESVVQYHVRLRLQVAKCGFTDPDNVIRSKILQTMRDKKLRREAMVKRYTLQLLLEHAANKEDIDRQVQVMEQKLAPDQERVNRIHPRRTQKPKDKRKPRPPRDDKKEGACQFYGIDHKGPRSTCPASGKTCGLCSKKREPVPLVGRFDAEIESISTGSRTIATFPVAKGTTKSRPLLSVDTRVELGLLHLTNATHEKKRETASQVCAPSTDPVVSKLTSEYHEVFSAQKAAKEEQRVKELGIIEAVTDRVPNTAILRPVTEALTVEDIKLWLEGATVFSVLDMNEGYHQLELDEDSRHLTTVYGTDCKMRYTRLNYGTI
ncbi:hypothetical protein P5673_013077 [Acropora cervicornis]|uniref:Uncharacterized protein n=1 Tax=Acropora cervicornis TaxID=6130 RepID=A0AAD9QLC1_ACRCE|nr:hypothetical protein P5673_013077 [Acropora cervicornis]